MFDVELLQRVSGNAAIDLSSPTLQFSQPKSAIGSCWSMIDEGAVDVVAVVVFADVVAVVVNVVFIMS